MIVAHPSGDLSKAVWIDLLSPTAEESEQVRVATGLRVPTQHDIEEIESTSRLAFTNGAYYLSTPGAGAATGFVLSSRVLLTVHFGAVPPIEAAPDITTAEDAFLRIIERIVDRSADELERAGAECDELSHTVFKERSHSRALGIALRRLGKFGDHASHVRDTLLGIGRISAYVIDSGIAGAPQVNAARLKAVRTDVASLTDYQSHLTGKIQFLLDATLGFINIEQNEIVKTLTIASVVGIPPVLIAGIYGMNFKVMPELSWPLGYPFALALIFVSALLPLAWFKWRGWL